MSPPAGARRTPLLTERDLWIVCALPSRRFASGPLAAARRVAGVGLLAGDVAAEEDEVGGRRAGPRCRARRPRARAPPAPSRRASRRKPCQASNCVAEQVRAGCSRCPAGRRAAASGAPTSACRRPTRRCSASRSRATCPNAAIAAQRQRVDRRGSPRAAAEPVPGARPSCPESEVSGWKPQRCSPATSADDAHREDDDRACR